LERLVRKILPLGIHLLDQPDLPRAIPLLESLLPLNRLVHFSVRLEVHEDMHAVFLGESFHRAIAMRFNASAKIGCHAYVERSVGFAGEDVDGRLLHSGSNALARAGVDS
jgi:hypothetical protein